MINTISLIKQLLWNEHVTLNENAYTDAKQHLFDRTTFRILHTWVFQHLFNIFAENDHEVSPSFIFDQRQTWGALVNQVGVGGNVHLVFVGFHLFTSGVFFSDGLWGCDWTV